jgi:hypothetical protein
VTDERPYLGDFFGQGPMHATFKMRVFTPRTTEEFDVYGYRIDKGHLMLYIATEAANNSVRLHPQAVFVPGGWMGYATADDAPPESMPMGFKPTQSP